MTSKAITAALALVLASAASADWRLTKGSSYSRSSAQDASAKACRIAENQCLHVYEGDITSRRCYTTAEDLQIIVGYGGVIYLWTATEVVGCSY